MTLPERFFFSQLSVEEQPDPRYQRLLKELEEMYRQLAFSLEHQSFIEEWTPYFHSNNIKNYTLQTGKILNQKHTKEFFFEIECEHHDTEEDLVLSLPKKAEEAKSYCKSLPIIGMIYAVIDNEVFWGSVLVSDEGDRGRLVRTGNDISPILSGKKTYLQGNFKILLE